MSSDAMDLAEQTGYDDYYDHDISGLLEED